MNPNDFVDKWRNVKLKERSAVQEHFLDLCALVGHGSPAQEDPTGERFTFEAGPANKKAVKGGLMSGRGASLPGSTKVNMLT